MRLSDLTESPQLNYTVRYDDFTETDEMVLHHGDRIVFKQNFPYDRRSPTSMQQAWNKAEAAGKKQVKFYTDNPDWLED